MNELEALKESVEKWRKIVDREGEDQGPHNCPLCAIFWRKDCDGCPIEEHTSMPGCQDTPYDEWEDYWIEKENASLLEDEIPRIVHDKESQQLAEKEYLFLKGLYDCLSNTGS